MSTKNNFTVSAIICEFNPLHSGHKRLIDYAKSISDAVVCIMSGNFTQRGMPACCDKHSRARHAILAGADLVLELPTVFATSSAENFALGGVAIAKQLGANYLVFGSECGSTEQLEQCASLLEQPQTNDKIRQLVATGMSYPTAVAKATDCDVLQSPNNTLAVEYIKAIKTLGANITPKTLQREDNFHGQPQEFASSSALRKNGKLLQKFSFDFVACDVDDGIEQKYKAVAPHVLSLKTKAQLEQIEGATEGLHNRIFACNKQNGFDQMMAEIKTKRYTMAKLQRVVLASILDVTKQTIETAKTETPQTSVLAMRNGFGHLLQQVNQGLDDVTKRADIFYQSLGGKPSPTKMQVLN